MYASEYASIPMIGRVIPTVNYEYLIILSRKNIELRRIEANVFSGMNRCPQHTGLW